MTYSLAITGVRASPSLPASYILSDDNARPGDQANAMQNGTAFLCKGPDGAEAYYTIDAERSLPGYPPVLLPVGP